MSQLEKALRRLDGAMARLEFAIAGLQDRPIPEAGPDAAELEADRERLAEEVGHLRARAEEDARLRAEAADAVRDALHDLRGAIGQEPQGMGGNA